MLSSNADISGCPHFLLLAYAVFFFSHPPGGAWFLGYWYKGRNILTGADKDIFGGLTLNNCSITSYRTLLPCIL